MISLASAESFFRQAVLQADQARGRENPCAGERAGERKRDADQDAGEQAFQPAAGRVSRPYFRCKR